jgi:hypothetical protein
VLDAILSKADCNGRNAKVAYRCLARLTGFSVRHVMRLTQSLERDRHLLLVDRCRLWSGRNAINVYHVVVPWQE